MDGLVSRAWRAHYALSGLLHCKNCVDTRPGYVKIAMEHGPVEIVDFPMKHGDFPIEIVDFPMNHGDFP